MATSSVTVGVANWQVAGVTPIGTLAGTSPTSGMSLSTADAQVGKVSVRSVEQIPVYDSTGAVISRERAQFTFPFAPTDIRIDGLTDNYSELGRPGLRPLVRRDSKNALKIAFTARIVNRSAPGTASCEELIDLLSSIASLNKDLHLIGMGVIASGKKFRITDMASETKRMNPQQQITMADVSLTFTEVVTVGLPVPGMTLLKDVSNSISSTTSLRSGTKAPSSTEEIDRWTAAKNKVRP